ncbi:V-type ATP synthase subunit C [Clostridium septicum]|uniref:V-type ATP synthase subunit C n=1 Tax=Clostridium septicum TaxID=1504 RepID=A0A9N7JN91_CLOSE|nr:V-type ATP synthase subunit C [Clostridium septicum]AYE35079.1 V-type ATP synthase subunit C [Clostridium septicum]MDU1312669.1 V-type ATP synthase subunit C [Clostridium septicum]QAS60472.1 V-type ATP synthase subunit C [Clostridium septicum]UEC20271.1 V-type ATP synthase subunit C [Clostridium septicum]USS01676.1 V-type ATP synthase subunit C [Clostridium septicum]
MDVMQFTQALSRIWVLETRLLDKSKIERMIDADSADEALKVLGETEYSNVMTNIKRATDYEEILTAELKRIYDLVKELCPVKDVVKLMSIKYDYHNLKVILKGKFLGKDLSHMLIHLGDLDLHEVKRKIDSENYKELEAKLEKAVVEAANDFESTKDPQKIDIIIDRYMFKEMVELKNELDYEFIDKFVKAIIDSTNVRTLLRIKKQNKNREFALEVLVPGGSIDPSTLVALINESPENIISKLNSTIYSEMIKEGIEAYINTDSVNLLEKLSDNYIMALMKDSKLVTFGPERILSYIYAKETEIKIIRIIMVGKLNNIAEEVIKERLRDIYV